MEHDLCGDQGNHGMVGWIMRMPLSAEAAT